MSESAAPLTTIKEPPTDTAPGDRRMPPDGREPSPTVRRRRLGTELRRLREERGLSAEEVARRLEWGKTRPLYLENARGQRPDPNDVALLCDVYEVTGDARDELIQLARDGRLRGWWHPYSKMLAPVYSTYIGLEAEAAAIRAFQPLVIPGLAQTQDYARALTRGLTTLTDDEIEQRVRVRTERQRVLTAADPVQLNVVLDEAAIRRAVGGPDVMRAQLEHLAALAKRPNVTVQVVPFRNGAHPGMDGAFTILGFPHAADPPAVYIEAISGQLFVEGEDVGVYEDAYDRLTRAAATPADSIGLISGAVADIR